ncbi:MAG: flagellin [Candidatus Latescibacteria bacterium]|nr:flagellin [Candidatus Latescibacterota bacterium]
MPLRVNNNITAINARRALAANSRTLSTRIERLATGLRINRAADDAAGLAVSEGLRAEIGGMTQAVRNAEHATNLTQVAEGALNEVSAMLIRMRELAAQSSSSTINDDNRVSLTAEYNQLISEIDRIANVTSYNNTVLLIGFGNTVSTNLSTSLSDPSVGVSSASITGAQAGSYTFIDTDSTDSQITLGNGTVTQTINIATALDGNRVATGTTAIANFDRLGITLNLNDAFTDGDLDGRSLVILSGTGGSFQVGPDNGAFNQIEFTIADMRASGPALNLTATSIGTLQNARSALPMLDLAIDRIARERGNIGAIQNRMAFTIASTQNAIQNIQASESSIRDADVAEEVSEFSRAQILTQAATAILVQANAIPQTALSLLQ